MIEFARTEFAKNGYAHWLAGCSVGKTLAALMLVEGHQRTLVLTVKNAITNAWVNDIKTKTNMNCAIIYPMKGTVAQRLAEIKELLALNTTAIVLLNYEAAAKIGSTELAAMKFDLVIADEVHKLKSFDSKQSKEIALGCKDIPHKLGMTGTSWNDRPTDVYGQFRFYTPCQLWRGKKLSLESRLLGSWYSFFERYVMYRTWEKIKIPYGFKNLDLLGKLIDPHTFYLKTEDARELPPIQHIKIKVKMTEEMERAYNEMQKDMIATFGKQLMVADCTLACATRLHQLTSGVWTDTELKELYDLKGGSPKTEAALDILEGNDEPVVIFTRFKSDVDNLEAALDKAKITHLKVVGGTSQADEWAAGKARVLIANMSAGATGLNLQRARIAIFYAKGYSATDYEQALWRIRRPESDITLPVVYYHLIVEDSVDEEISDAIDSKGVTADKLLKELKNRI